MNTASKKILSLTLATLLAVGTTPISAFVNAVDIPTNSEIVAFAALGEATAIQAVALGTSWDALNLPYTLAATVRAAQEPEQPPEDETPAEQPPESPPTAPPAMMSVPVPAAWESVPLYDGDTEGVYIFTAKIEGYTVSALPPVITVMVGPEQGGSVTAFAELPEDIRWQRGMSINLPEAAEGTVVGENRDIPVTWDCETDPTQTGLHAFTATPDEGYTLAEGVSTPTIAFIRESSARMGGTGTQTNPLKITTASQLAEIAAAVNEGKLEEIVTGSKSGTVYLKLTKNLDFSFYSGNGGWKPIGNNTNQFKGSFDGDGHTITGLTISRTIGDYQGLFGVIASSGTVEKLGLMNFTVSGNDYVGGMAGRVLGTVKNCYSMGSVSGENYVGGMAGEVSGMAENCYSTGSISGENYVGGVAGYVNSGMVQYCAALNPGITGTDNVGRVAGANAGTLSGNIAFSTMTVNSSTVSGGTATDRNGEGKAASELKTADFPGVFLEAPWTCTAGELPNLGRTAVEMPGHISSYAFAGSGSVSVPFLISTAAELAKLAELVNGNIPNYKTSSYKLTADLELSDYMNGEGWVPIGNDTNKFEGSFDGDGHTITGLTINRDANRQALFGQLKGAEVKNLGLIDVKINGKDYVAGVAGYHEGNTKIIKCYVTGTIKGIKRVGGIAGIIINTGDEITNCYTAAHVTASGTVSSDNPDAGGIVGTQGGGAITNCYATGTVSGRNSGGILGRSTAGSVINCAALNPSVTSSANTVGRVVGTHGTITLTDNRAFSGMSVNDGTVSGGAANNKNGQNADADDINREDFFKNLFKNDSAWTYELGRLPGLFKQTVEMPEHLKSSTSRYFQDGDGTSATPFLISTAAQLAKLADIINNNNNNTTYNTSNVNYRLTADLKLSAYTYSGGEGWAPIGNNSSPFRGSFDGNGHTIAGLTVNRPEGDYQALFGCIANGGKVENLDLTDVSVAGRSYVGGVAGQVSGTVESCYSTGYISGTAGYVGGIAGQVSGTVQNCYSTANVGGDGAQSGGVAGGVSGTTANCYSTGSVDSTGARIGGIAGEASGTVKDCAALNPLVSGTSNVGCVIGDKSGGTAQNNYAFTGMSCTSSISDVDDGMDVTVSQAVTPAFWTTAGNWQAGGWNDTTIWRIDDGKLPILRKAGSNQDGDTGLYLTPKNAENFNIYVQDATYTGLEILPSITVYFGSQKLVSGTDYTFQVTSSDDQYTGTSAGTNAGRVTLAITGMGGYTSNNTATFNINKATPQAPAAPTAMSKTASSVTLNAVSAGTGTVEYAVSTIDTAPSSDLDWQTATTFNGLAANTTYYFFARIKADNNHNASSEASVSIRTEKATLAGTVTINGTAKYGETLTANPSISSLSPGTLRYEWRRNGSAISDASSSSYQLTADDVGKDITVAVTAENYNGEVASTEVKVGKATPGYSIPGGLTATYGDMLFTVALTDGFTWEAAGTASVGNAGTQTSFTVKYTPNDTTLYETVAGISVSIEVAAKSVTIETGDCSVTKSYDGTVNPGTNFEGALSISGILSGDTAVIVNVTPENYPYADVGSYTVTANLALSGTGHENYSLANTTINGLPAAITKKEVTITPDSGQGKVYGAADPTALTFINDGGLTSFSGMLSRAEGENAGNYAINLGSLSAGANYALTLSTAQVDFIITQATVQSISTTVNDVTMTALEARNAATTQAVVNLVSLPESVTVVIENGTAALPISWATTDSYDARGTAYNVTGTLTGSANIANGNNVTASITITVNPTVATNPVFSDTLVVVDSYGGSAAALALVSAGVLPASGSITVNGVNVDYTISWDEGYLNTGTVGNDVTFTGTASYPGAPAWLTQPDSLSVTRKVTVTDKTQTTISVAGGITNKEYTGTAYTYGAVSSGAVNANELEWRWESIPGGTYDSPAPPSNAGNYQVTISVPGSNPAYCGSVSYTFSITRAALTIRAEDKTARQNDPLPPVTIYLTGFRGGDNESNAFSTPPVAAYSVSDTNMPGSFGIDFITPAVLFVENYAITHQSGTLTVNAKSASCDIISVLSPKDAAISGADIAASVGSGVESQQIEVTASPGAKWALYSDAACTDEITNKTMPVLAGVNTAYIKVTSENGVAVKIYTITITRNTSGSGSKGKGNGGTPSQMVDGNGIKVFGVNIPYTIAGGIASLDFTPALLDKILEQAKQEYITVELSGSIAIHGIDIGFIPAWFAEHPDTTIIIQSGFGGVYLNNNAAQKYPAQYTRAILSVQAGSLTLSARQSGKAVTWNRFDAPVIVYMPYALKHGEDQATVVLYDKADGKTVAHSFYADGWVYGALRKPGTYDAKSVTVGIADTERHWAKKDITYAVSHGLLDFVTGSAFSPDTAITRADFVVVLGKLSGANVSGYTESSFSDVANDSSALPYIEWAYKNKMIDGVGGGKFAPNQSVTREQMAVMIANYSTFMHLTLPEIRQTSAFSDAGRISSWAKNAVASLKRANIIAGKTGNKFDPQGSITRAEASSVLHCFAESAIKGKIGWVQTEKGQWQYIQNNYMPQIGWLVTVEGNRYYFDKDGFRVSGKWLQIGGEWYYFYADGKMAVHTTIDGYEVGVDGVRK